MAVLRLVLPGTPHRGAVLSAFDLNKDRVIGIGSSLLRDINYNIDSGGLSKKKLVHYKRGVTMYKA